MLWEVKKAFRDIVLKKYDFVLDDFDLQEPPKKNLWDLTFGCFVLSKDLKKNPNIISQELGDFINDSEWEFYSTIESVNVAWPYVNIKVNKKIYTSLFQDIYDNLKKPLSFGEGQEVIFDYIGANVWKPLHIGHMCTPNIGQALINVYRKLWYTVIGDSHIGDWGIIFGKLMSAYKLWWDEKKLEKNAVNHLFELYVKVSSEAKDKPELEQAFRDEFKLLSEWNPASVSLWKQFTSSSIDSMEGYLKRLNVTPDYNIWESFYEGIGLPKLWKYPDLAFTMKDIVSELIEKWIATQNDDGSVWVVFDDETKIPSCVLQKRDGTHGYLASDLASIKYRMWNWTPNKIIYCVDVRQKLHFQQAFEIARKADWIGDTKLLHAYNGFISLKDGAMSTRTGKIIPLDMLLDEAEKRASKIIQEKRDDIGWDELKKLSALIGIGAIKYGYLKKSRETDVIFDFDEFISFEWNSGPYIQYAYVRAKRILERSDVSHIKDIPLGKDIVFENDEEIQLVKSLWEYKATLEETAHKNMPHILCSYTYSLTKTFSSFYNNVHILNEEDNGKKNIRLKLIDAFCYTIKDAFEVLWIDMPEKM